TEADIQPEANTEEEEVAEEVVVAPVAEEVEPAVEVEVAEPTAEVETPETEE
ncbi:MAG TPA: chemotaxis protein CheW, partial [Flavobacterium sp.]|nr:chemotaxis protein CheW [Flavobacterium sp.]